MKEKRILLGKEKTVINLVTEGYFKNFVILDPKWSKRDTVNVVKSRIDREAAN